jgi:D-arginine dehydrogenase
LATHGTVVLVEAEARPGYHSSGRSAALYTRNYGGPVVRCISAASHDFFTDPPDGFCDGPLLSPRGCLTVAAPGQEDGIAATLALSGSDSVIERITAAHALELAPLLRPERVAAAAIEHGVTDIDVASLHQGYLRGFARRGGIVVLDHRIERLDRRDGLWHATASAATIAGRVLVNAAGAWAKRRTGIIVDAPQGAAIGAMPAVDFAGCDAYLKPEAGRLMASPGDETPMEPQDARPDELDIALLIDWLERETLISVARIEHSWAGLRSFVADNAPVVGFDAAAPDFAWLAGQGGYGIMMAPALARATAALILTGAFPGDLVARGIVERDLSPARLA